MPRTRKRGQSVTSAAALGLLVAGALSTQVAQAAAGGGTGWTMSGYDTSNSRYNARETTLTTSNVGQLQQKWRVATEGDVSATPAVDAGTVYVPDFAGNLYALDSATGAQRWKTKISDYTGISGDHSRSTPAISGNLLILGDQAGKAFSPDGYLLGVNKNTGALVWKTKVTGGFPILTQGATIKGGIAYVGVASYEEALVAFAGVPLTFRGSVMAVDANTGIVKWTTAMVPVGYTGGSVWGSSPVIDSKRNSLYVTTGNNYSIPQAATDCLSTATTDAQRTACIAPNDYFDSIVALDLSTGAVKWATKALPSDAWNVSCGIPGIFPPSPTGCPENAGPDYDFGQGATLYSIKSGGKSIDVVGAGQKSGKYWALSADTGAVLWSTQAVPGGIAGGLQWGSATDGVHIYVANSNSQYQPWTLTDGSVQYGNGGWESLNAVTGQIEWQTPNPAFGNGMGPVSGANGIVFACSMDPDGHMYAMDSVTGSVLWDFTSGASCLGGAAVSDGMVFWGTGYDAFSPAPDNDQALYAFGL